MDLLKMRFREGESDDVFSIDICFVPDGERVGSESTSFLVTLQMHTYSNPRTSLPPTKKLNSLSQRPLHSTLDRLSPVLLVPKTQELPTLQSSYHLQ